MDNDDRDAPEGNGCCGTVLIGIFGFITILLFPLSVFVAIKIIPEYQRAVIFRLGRIKVCLKIFLIKILYI